MRTRGERRGDEGGGGVKYLADLSVRTTLWMAPRLKEMSFIKVQCDKESNSQKFSNSIMFAFSYKAPF